MLANTSTAALSSLLYHILPDSYNKTYLKLDTRTKKYYLFVTVKPYLTDKNQEESP